MGWLLEKVNIRLHTNLPNRVRDLAGFDLVISPLSGLGSLVDNFDKNPLLSFDVFK